EQVDPVIELGLVDAGAEVLDTAGSIVDDQWLMASAEEASAIAAVADRDEIRHGVGFAAELLGDDGAEGGILDASLSFAIASVHVVGGTGVGPFRRAHAADDRRVIREPSELREMFADLDAVGGRLNLAERAALLGARPKVKRVLVARSAGHPEEDAALG